MKLSLDNSVQLILNFTYEELKKQKHFVLTAEHVLYVALTVYPINRFLESLEVNVKELGDKLQEESKKLQLLPEVDTFPYDNTVNDLRKSPSFVVLIESAFINAVKDSRAVVGVKDLLMSFIEVDRRQYTTFQYSQYIDVNRMSEVLRYGLVSSEILFKIDNVDSITEEEIDMFTSLFGEIEYDEDENSSGIESESLGFDNKRKKNQIPKLTTNLCSIAKQEGFDTFVGQTDTLHKIYEILLRKNKNNVILVGDTGVGKTAIIQEFANRIVANDVPEELKGYNLLRLDIVSLVAGTRYRGDFEDRVKQLTESLTQNKRSILFLDDVHSVINAGSSAGNSNDFGDLIKPLLVDNVVRCIGTTTFEEFKVLEKEKSLLRRFNIIEMNEPSPEETFNILNSIKEQYESFYNISYSSKILQDIIDLSNRYVFEKFFPDKAVDILDAVGAMLRVRQYTTTPQKKSTLKLSTKNIPATAVTTKDVEEIISSITKRPIQSIQKEEIASLHTLGKRLSKKIFGQELAISSLSKVITRSRTGLREQTKPIASILFVGPTGVGKTELSKQLAFELGMNFLRYDMSEYQERHAVSKFIGAPPGYVGYEHGGILVDSIRRNPNSVLLLDEIEKAHSDVFNLLLQIMDYATITDSVGRKADFRNIILIMSSNAGAQESIKSVVGFEKNQIKGNQEIRESINNLFSPEFRNRMDETIVFSPLALEHMKAIIEKELRVISTLLLKKQITLEWNDEVTMYLVKKGFDTVYGARSVLRVIESEVKDALAETLIKLAKRKKKEHKTVMLTLNKKFDIIEATNLSDIAIKIVVRATNIEPVI